MQTKFQNESNRFDNNPCKQNSEVNLSSIGQFLSWENYEEIMNINYEEIMNSLPNQNWWQNCDKLYRISSKLNRTDQNLYKHK